ncbi:DUF695 domain-containing protein [uncultured Psychroserpens sp.]|uniref:DUF695 domain-containing protein n=1 Tax=uncultured Psychroserpens sp. TaxID=255436 RepID=UPI00261678C4|nr:DUF695 domain-containing protein [uncultured Psychroserpens sp.]
MEWLTTKTEYDGLPLYLRLPNYKNVWEFRVKYPQLVCITHMFDSVKDNGLPADEYNKSLMDFDREIVNLFDPNKNGIVFLVETYGGARNYWFYITDSKFFFNVFEELKIKHSDKKLELDYQNDSHWNFIKDYPIKLYKPE